MRFTEELHNKSAIDTGYAYWGRPKDSYVYTGYVDRFMEKIHGLGWAPKVYLDIGSRDLIQTIEVAQYHSGTRFLAFEPVPWQYRVCYERSLEWENIEVYNLAISNEEGYADFWEMDTNTGGSSLLEPIDVPGSNNISKKITVECKRLDNFLKSLGIEKVDCLWIDTQGTELNVLKGLGDYIDDVLFIQTEAAPKPYYKGHILKSEVEDFLTEKGFVVEFYTNGPHPYDEGDIIAYRPELVHSLLNSN